MLTSCSFVCAVLCAAKSHYGTSLANVDWLHGSAESLLTITNLLVGESALVVLCSRKGGGLRVCVLGGV
jgi:hypothetical protein